VAAETSRRFNREAGVSQFVAADGAAEIRLAGDEQRRANSPVFEPDEKDILMNRSAGAEEPACRQRVHIVLQHELPAPCAV